MPEPSRTTDATPALDTRWHDGLTLLNLRGHPDDPAFVQAAAGALGQPLPTEPGRTTATDTLRIVWAGPDDWFVIGPAGQAESLAAGLRSGLKGVHAAVTDVSSGYTVLELSGQPVRQRLAQGCPLDLHPRVFGPGHCAGTHFFKASVWLWRPGDDDRFALLVRRSFRAYVGLMLERAARSE